MALCGRDEKTFYAYPKSIAGLIAKLPDRTAEFACTCASRGTKKGEKTLYCISYINFFDKDCQMHVVN